MIRIFITGGTFDKHYDELNGKLSFGETHIFEMLQLGRNKTPVSAETLMMVDSLDMTSRDRMIIASSCDEAKEDKIVITHGTDTMCETAAFVAMRELNKVIVLTGAMVPYAFGSSDGLFNLGSAIAFVQTLPAGVYVVMNGKCFSARKVKNKRDTGEFVES